MTKNVNEKQQKRGDRKLTTQKGKKIKKGHKSEKNGQERKTKIENTREKNSKSDKM